MDEYDFFETPITPYTVLVDQAEVELHIRDTATMEQSGVKAIVGRSLDKLPEGQGFKLNVYGRLGERISTNGTSIFWRTLTRTRLPRTTSTPRASTSNSL